MEKLKVYMDNCCYGRPYDDLSQAKVKNEAIAKMYIQSLVKFKSITLYSSFMLSYEISQCPVEATRESISQFVDEHSSFHISKDREAEIVQEAQEIMETGIKYKDSVHLACSIYAGCDYFITTDDRVTKYQTDKIKIVNPIDFVRMWESAI